MKTVVIALVVLLSACGNSDVGGDSFETLIEPMTQQSRLLAPEAFKAALAEQTDHVLIDVRTPGEVAGGSIIGAQNIDYNGADFATEVDKLDKSKRTFVYCAKGGRSGGAASILAKKGFTDIVDLEGGVTAWSGAGFSVE
jgi:rhodanese-related sulfurtransferase